MLLEVAKRSPLFPKDLAVCVSCRNLVPASDMHQRICDSLGLLALAAAISPISGLIFRDATQEPSAGRARLTATLPVQVFCWGSSGMLVLFIVSWYLESHCIFYRDVRF